MSRNLVSSTVQNLLYGLTRPQFEQLCTKLEYTHPLPKETVAERAADLWSGFPAQPGIGREAIEEAVREVRGLPPTCNLLYLNCADDVRGKAFARQFFDDLTGRLRPFFGGRELRYFDESDPEDRSLWFPWSRKAIGEAPLMICLYTRSFFRSDYCGKLWRVFRDRAAAAQGAGRPALTILPIYWEKPGSLPRILPRVADELGAVFDHGRFGQDYFRDGLRVLIQEANPPDSPGALPYQNFLNACVAYVRERLQGVGPLESTEVGPLDGIESDFAGLAEDEEPPAAPTGLPNPKVVYLSARKTEVNPVSLHLLRPVAARTNVDFRQAYDDAENGYWKPYFPGSTSRIHQLGRAAALALDPELDPEEIRLDRSFDANLDRANREGRFILMIVDPLSLMLTAYRERANTCDTLNLPWSEVLVCWDAEEGTDDRRRNLDGKVSAGFRLRTRPGSRQLPRAVESLAELRMALGEIFIEMRRVAVATSNRARPATGLNFVQPAIIPAQVGVLPSPPRPRAAESGQTASISLPRLQGPTGPSVP